MTLETIVWLAGGFVISFGVSAGLTPWVRKVARLRRWTDRPDEARKLHKEPIPRVGGLAIVAGFTGACLYAAIGSAVFPGGVALPGPAPLWLLGALLIVGMGFWDDVHGLSHRPKFAVQIAAAAAAIAAGYRLHLPVVTLGDLPLDLDVLAVPLSLLWIVGVTNAVNLLDGMDGLAAGTSVISLLSLAAAFAITGLWAEPVLVVAVTGAVLGFLCYNFHPASIFMGDTGSQFLGFVLATFALGGAGHLAGGSVLAIPLLALGVPLLDTSLAISRRLAAGHSVFHADGDHLHHRIARVLTLSHHQVVLVLYAAGLVLGSMAMLTAAVSAAEVLWVWGGGGVLLLVALRKLGYLGGRPVRQRRKHHPGSAERDLHRGTRTPSQHAAHHGRSSDMTYTEPLDVEA